MKSSRSRRLVWVAAVCGVGLFGAVGSAQMYRAEVINEAAPAEGLAPEIAERLAPTGIRVVRDEGRSVIEIWPCKEWSVEPGFEATLERLYPFQPGALIGVARLARRGSDFRGQDIARGVYTLRFGLQPIDGNHVGTSPTRDFLLMVKADEDMSPGPVAIPDLMKASAAAAGANHPAMLCLQKATDGAAGPALRHLESQDWWILQFSAATAGTAEPLPVDLVVVGHAAE